MSHIDNIRKIQRKIDSSPIGSLDKLQLVNEKLGYIKALKETLKSIESGKGINEYYNIEEAIKEIEK